jgi:transposase
VQSQRSGYVSQVASYNSIIRYFDSPMLTDYLRMLIEESSLPLQAIEEDFAVDSTGISTCRFVRWYEKKYESKGDGQISKSERARESRDWIKVHICTGVKTNVVTAVELSGSKANDHHFFKPLVEATRRNFTMYEVSADKAYLSNANLQTAVANDALPFIPFKSNSQNRSKKNGSLWSQMYHYFSLMQEDFMRRYHKRSNVESTFMMIKTEFGDALRSKTERAQINEALCKILCHNICCLISAMYELNLKPKFYAEVA